MNAYSVKRVNIYEFKFMSSKQYKSFRLLYMEAHLLNTQWNAILSKLWLESNPINNSWIFELMLESFCMIIVSFCSGRAGRERPGKCFRLYPENEFWKLEDSTKPDIKRCDLSNAILQLKALGVHDITRFDFIEKPSGWDIGKFGFFS